MSWAFGGVTLNNSRPFKEGRAEKLCRTTIVPVQRGWVIGAKR
jgi:hypothetical protein